MPLLPQTTLPPLLSLPPELRVHILEQLGIVQDEPVSIYAATKSPPVGRVCRVLREETMDIFFSRNRFIASSTMGLGSALDSMTPDNLSRVTRLRLSYLGPFPPNHLYTVDGKPSTPPRPYFDVDLATKPPWLRLGDGPNICFIVDGFEAPSPILHYLRAQRLQVDGRGGEQFGGLPESVIRFLLVPKLMENAMHSLVRQNGDRMIRLDRMMLERIVQHWQRISHLLDCGAGESLKCEDCKRALSWLAT